MHISQVTMDGFKCYTEKTTLKNLDRSFNAIMGMNGSGKSNVIDAIVFCLDLGTSKNMRVSNLKELINIHKTKATVILSIKDAPNYGDIEVSRTITYLNNVVRTVFKINNTVCTKATINNLVKSCGMSSDFIIMQGHITKVINMKGSGLKGMIEEVAGTKNYNVKHEQSLKQIEEKETLLNTAKTGLEEKIAPFLHEMKKEREIYEKNKDIEINRKKYKKELNKLEEYKEILKTKEQAKKLEEIKNNYISLNEKYNLTVENEKLQVEKEEIEMKREMITESENEIYKLKKDLINFNDEEYHRNIEIINNLHATKELLTKQQMGMSSDKFNEMEKIKREINRLKNIDAKVKNKTDEEIDQNISEIKKELTTLRNKEELQNKIQSYKNKLSYDVTNKRICGKVHELFGIKEEKYALAVWTVLGGKAEFLVVEDDETGAHLLKEILIKETKNKMTVVPLNKLLSTQQNKHSNSIINKIKYDQKYDNVFNRFLGGYLIFDACEEARDACFKYKIKTITTDGTVYDPHGTLTGGKNKNLVLHRINYREEIKRCVEEINKINKTEITKSYEEYTIILTQLENEKILRGKQKEFEFLEKTCGAQFDVEKELKKIKEEIFKEERNNVRTKEIYEKNLKIERKIKSLEEKIEKGKEELNNIEEQFNKQNQNFVCTKEDKTEIFRQLSISKNNLSKMLKSLECEEKNIDGFIKNANSEHDHFIKHNESFMEDIANVDIHKRIKDLTQNFSVKTKEIQMDPGNFNFLETNSFAMDDLKQKIDGLQKDKKDILRSMSRIINEGEKEFKTALEHINRNFQRMVNYFLSNFKVYIDKETFKICVVKKNNVYTLSELSGGQRSIIALSLMFSTLTYKPAPFYIFDEIDAALDMNFTQSIGEIIKKEFSNAQFFVVSLKNNMFDNANKIFNVYIEDKKSKIKCIK